ncbi:hypothetical protein [Sellimonas intestinalis]
MEDTVKPGELYSYHQNGIEEILSKRQLEDFFFSIWNRRSRV